MQDAGYNTYYTGKLYNAHNVDNYNDPPISGFNGSDFILDPYTYEYFNARMTRNAAPPISYAGQYSPDVVFEKAQGFLHEALLHPDPWFLTVAPIAPHSNCRMVPDNDGCHFPRYADRHAHLFKDYKIPRDSSFNPDKVCLVANVECRHLTINSKAELDGSRSSRSSTTRSSNTMTNGNARVSAPFNPWMKALNH